MLGEILMRPWFILSPAELLVLHDRFQQMIADYNALPAGQKYEEIRPLKRNSTRAGSACTLDWRVAAGWMEKCSSGPANIVPSQ
jgi:hypothetical protein